MQAIPKWLLIHRAIRYKTSKDRWGQETPEEGQELAYIRIEPSSKVVRDKNRAEVQLAATLFYDCRNSRPRGVEWEEDDIVMVNGERYRVQVIEPLYDGRRLHHYELGMVRHA
nr:MAG TPA: Minor capsid protein [Caudoviricetes sp.]